jgi:hypothetical protein
MLWVPPILFIATVSVIVHRLMGNLHSRMRLMEGKSDCVLKAFSCLQYARFLEKQQGAALRIVCCTIISINLQSQYNGRITTKVIVDSFVRFRCQGHTTTGYYCECGQVSHASQNSSSCIKQ